MADAVAGALSHRRGPQEAVKSIVEIAGLTDGAPPGPLCPTLYYYPSSCSRSATHPRVEASGSRGADWQSAADCQSACRSWTRPPRPRRIANTRFGFAALWGRIVSCAPVGNRRWSACLQATRAGYQPAGPRGYPSQPAPQFLPDARFWDQYVALDESACQPISSRVPTLAVGHVVS